MRVPSRNSGFTLLEVLVALSLMSVAMLLIFGGLKITSRSWLAGTAKIDQMAELQAAHRVFSAVISKISSLPIKQQNRTRYAFEGNQTELRFVSFSPVAAAPPGLYRVSLFPQNQSSQGGLNIAVALFDNTSEGLQLPFENKEIFSLIDAPIIYGFTYFGALRPNGQPAWHDTWDAIDSMPSLVRLRVVRKGVAWPDLIAPIAVNMDPDCVFLKSRWTVKCRLDPAQTL